MVPVGDCGWKALAVGRAEKVPSSLSLKKDDSTCVSDARSTCVGEAH